MTGSGRSSRSCEGNLDCPVWVAGRLAFLSDHDGAGRLYSCAPDGTDVRRHDTGTGIGADTDTGTDAAGVYARHASSDGERVVYQRAGDLWLVDGLDAEPSRLDVRLAGPAYGPASARGPSART